MRVLQRNIEAKVLESIENAKVTYSINQNGVLTIRIGVEIKDTLIMLSPEETKTLKKFLDEVRL